MDIFFYGLFMDKRRLEQQGLSPSKLRKARLSGYQLKIGERATLVEESNANCYGVLINLPPDDVLKLYSAPGVDDYQPLSVSVQVAQDQQELAICYVLPEHDDHALGDDDYITELHKLGSALHFPEYYLDEILRCAESSTLRFNAE